MYRASWIFLLFMSANDMLTISQLNFVPGFVPRYFAVAESCLIFSCYSHRFSAISFVSPIYDSSGAVAIVPRYITFALYLTLSFKGNNVLIFLDCHMIINVKFFSVNSFNLFKKCFAICSFLSQNGTFIGINGLVSCSLGTFFLFCSNPLMIESTKRLG